MGKVVLAPCIEKELWEIWKFIALDNPDAAMRVIEAAYKSFQILADAPGVGKTHKFRDARLKEIRSWRVSGFSNYLIFYRPIKDGIQVLHVYHGARDIESFFGKK